MSPLVLALAVFAAFLLGLRAGIAIGYRAERRRFDGGRRSAAAPPTPPAGAKDGVLRLKA